MKKVNWFKIILIKLNVNKFMNRNSEAAAAAAPLVIFH